MTGRRLGKQKAFDSRFPLVHLPLPDAGALEVWPQMYLLALFPLRYSNPMAQISLQGHRSELFTNSSEMPAFSSTVYNSDSKTLATAIRLDSNILGVTSGDRNHICALFTNDLLLFVTSPHTTLTHLFSLLDRFGQISGLLFNCAKPEAMSVNLLDAVQQSLQV